MRIALTAASSPAVAAKEDDTRQGAVRDLESMRRGLPLIAGAVRSSRHCPIVQFGPAALPRARFVWSMRDTSDFLSVL